MPFSKSRFVKASCASNRAGEPSRHREMQAQLRNAFVDVLIETLAVAEQRFESNLRSITIRMERFYFRLASVSIKVWLPYAVEHSCQFAGFDGD